MTTPVPPPAKAVRRRRLLMVCGALALLLVIQLAARMRFVPAPPEAPKAKAAPQPDAGPAPASAAKRRLPVDLAGPMAVPVAGVRRSALYDSFTEARSGGRVHDAIDILAPAGTPVVAATAGRIEKLFVSDLGGNTVYIRTPDKRWIHYYAHLSGYAPGLREGMVIARGAPIGTVGSTGNADPAAPHLHFAIHHARPEEPWYQGDAVNPYPLLKRAR
ncbi:murein DD-endopeptidase MepM/ murein hydrolase activator NlpD [Sphingomonas zeicaulis]|uniref:M23 family metallopeptidase n=1 Tax=Sphingomonas zeicaulis TaxID=1632740 RepID=UPI003D263BE8